MDFIVPDICNQNDFFKPRLNDLSTVQVQMAQPSILKSHKHSKMIETILSFVFQNDRLQNCIMIGLSDTKILCLEIIFSNAIYSQTNFNILQLFF